MGLTKITLMRDEFYDSAKASKLLNSKKVFKLLKENNFEFRETFSSSDRLPLLIVPGVAYSYRGYRNILEYVNSLNPTSQQSESN